MAEKAADAQHEAALAPIRAESFGIRVAVIGSVAIPALFIISAIVLAALGEPVAAILSAAIGVAGGFPQVLQAVRRGTAQQASPPPRKAAPKKAPPKTPPKS